MINILNIDCMKLMAEKEDGHYDIAIVDPPYYANAETIIHPGGKLSTTGVKRRKYHKPKWQVPSRDYFRELFRVSRAQIIWGINYYDIPNPGPGRIVWDKVNDNGTSFSNCEIAYCSLIRRVVIFRYMWNGMCQGKSVSEGTVMRGNKKLNEPRFHPTQKPLALYQWLFQCFVGTGQRVLSTHGGSAPEAVVAADFGCELDVCEIDPYYHRLAIERYENHIRQLKLKF